jgi:hypothetical protein
MPTSRVARQPGASAVFGVASAMASISSLKAGHRALTPPVVMLPKNETRAAVRRGRSSIRLAGGRLQAIHLRLLSGHGQLTQVLSSKAPRLGSPVSPDAGSTCLWDVGSGRGDTRTLRFQY